MSSDDQNQFDDTYDELPLRCQSTAVMADDDYDLPQTRQVPTIMEDDYDLPRPSCKSHNVCVTDDEDDEYDVPQSSQLDFDVSFVCSSKKLHTLDIPHFMHLKCPRAHL